jgi:hypothetical protein
MECDIYGLHAVPLVGCQQRPWRQSEAWLGRRDPLREVRHSRQLLDLHVRQISKRGRHAVEQAAEDARRSGGKVAPERFFVASLLLWDGLESKD